MKLKKIIYEVEYYDNSAFDLDGEFIPDAFKIRDFPEFEQALEFAQTHYKLVGAARINKIEFGPHRWDQETLKRWEIDNTGYYPLEIL